MRYLTLIIAAITLVNCASNEYYDYKKHPEFGQPFTIKKIAESKYEIEFRGTPLTTINEAVEEWDYRARGICQGDYISLDYEDPKLEETKLVKSNPQDPGKPTRCYDQEFKVTYEQRLFCFIYLSATDTGPETDKGTYPSVKGIIQCKN